jgi:hypothetical protein
MGDGLFRTHGLQFWWSERVGDGLQPAAVEVDVSQVVVHEGDEPDAVVGFAQADFLACQDAGDGDIGLVEADLAGVSDDGLAVVERIAEVGQSAEAPRRS